MAHGKSSKNSSHRKPLSEQEKERRSKKPEFKKERKRRYAAMASGDQYEDESGSNGRTKIPIDPIILSDVVDLEDGWFELYGIRYLNKDGRDDGDGFSRKQIVRMYEGLFGPVSIADAMNRMQYVEVPYENSSAYVRVDTDATVRFPMNRGLVVITDDLDEIAEGRRFLYEE